MVVNKMYEGARLLKLFRNEQAKKEHIGCLCDECEENMENAIKKFKEEGGKI